MVRFCGGGRRSPEQNLTMTGWGSEPNTRAEEFAGCAEVGTAEENQVFGRKNQVFHSRHASLAKLQSCFLGLQGLEQACGAKPEFPNNSYRYKHTLGETMPVQNILQMTLVLQVCAQTTSIVHTVGSKARPRQRQLQISSPTAASGAGDTSAPLRRLSVTSTAISTALGRRLPPRDS